MLDVINLRNRHKALLSKWWWIIIRSFLLLFAFANMGNESLCDVGSPGIPLTYTVLEGISKLKEVFFSDISFVLGDGSHISFWQDK